MLIEGNGATRDPAAVAAPSFESAAGEIKGRPTDPLPLNVADGEPGEFREAKAGFEPEDNQCCISQGVMGQSPEDFGFVDFRGTSGADHGREIQRRGGR
jgi:hypothetical protein